MNTTVRALVIALGVLRALPAQLYITLGIIGLSLLTVAAPGAGPFGTLAGLYLTAYGGYRGIRRQLALHRFTKWTP